MKILLNGATGGDNFGDYLLAKIFQDYLSEKIGLENVYWHKSSFAYSDFFSRNLNNPKRCRLRDINGLIYISGGYFCGSRTRIIDYIRRYFRFLHIGIKCILLRIPYAIIGVDVKTSRSKVIQLIQKTVIKHSKIIVVRNNESFKYLKSWGIDHAICTADVVFALDEKLFKNIDVKINIPPQNKILLFHVTSASIVEKIVPIINAFIEKHKEYIVLITNDAGANKERQEKLLEYASNRIKSKLIIKNYYDDPLSLCKVIDNVDLIVTTKLHLGVVGAKLGKSVVSFSGHTEKIRRLYEEIGEPERTYPLEKLDFDTGIKMLEQFYDKPIKISDEVIAKSKKTLSFIDEFLKII